MTYSKLMTHDPYPAATVFTYLRFAQNCSTSNDDTGSEHSSDHSYGHDSGDEVSTTSATRPGTPYFRQSHPATLDNQRSFPPAYCLLGNMKFSGDLETIHGTLPRTRAMVKYYSSFIFESFKNGARFQDFVAKLMKVTQVRSDCKTETTLVTLSKDLEGFYSWLNPSDPRDVKVVEHIVGLVKPHINDLCRLMDGVKVLYPLMFFCGKWKQTLYIAITVSKSPELIVNDFGNKVYRVCTLCGPPIFKSLLFMFLKNDEERALRLIKVKRGQNGLKFGFLMLRWVWQANYDEMKEHVPRLSHAIGREDASRK